MKKKMVAIIVGGMAMVAGILYAADHIDAPGVTGPGSTSLGNDITDIYAFQSPADNSRMVLVCNVQGLMSPASTATATFAANTLYEMNIDNTGDNVEDLVIQFLVQNGRVRAYGPYAPTATGINSVIKADAIYTEAAITPYGSAPIVGTHSNGTRIFAGPRDDPFFFDLARFKEIIGGTQTGFRNPGIDAFAGTNVLSLVIELPKSLLGSGASINYWCEAKTK